MDDGGPVVRRSKMLEQCLLRQDLDMHWTAEESLMVT